MTKPRKIVDSRKDESGNISQVRLEKNQNFTSSEKVIEMVEKGTLAPDDFHVVRPKDGKPYLRSNPDDKTDNNLGEMADN